MAEALKANRSRHDLSRGPGPGPEGAGVGGAASASLLIKAVDLSERNREADTATSPVDRSSTVPLYVQIRRRLLSLVAGWPDPGRRFYTDDELCRMFGVARMTVRAAISEFVERGLLVRTRGAGTYVSFHRVEEHFSPRMDFMDQWAIHGRPLTLDVRTFDVVPAPDAFAGAMGLEPDAPLLLVERMRSAGGVPVSIDYRYILPEVASAVTRQSAGRYSLLDLLTNAVDLDHADMTIEASHAMGAICDLLELMPGDPVLVRGLIYYDTGERPVMAGVSYYRHDQSGYSIRVPLKTRPAEPDAEAQRTDSGGPAWGRLVHVKQILGRAGWGEGEAAGDAARSSAGRDLELRVRASPNKV